MLLNASGCLDALTAPDVARQLDGFVTKTITPLPREGNAPPRIAETAHGMLNAIGLANPGRRALPRRDAAAPARARRPDLGLGRRLLAPRTTPQTCAVRSDDVAAIELNLSCPNVDEAADSAAEIVAACRAATTLPLYAKLSAAHPDVAEVARAVAAAGADGLSLINTLRGIALDPETLRPVLARGSGGLSGPTLKPVALHAVRACYAAHRPADRRHGRRPDRAGRARADRLRRAPTSRSERCSSPTPTRRPGCAPSSPRRPRPRVLPALTTHSASRSEPEKRLDRAEKALA